MLATPSLVILSALSSSVSAQVSNPQVLAAVAFVNHGETTPSQNGGRSILTPIGAQQMLRQGTAFRNRYLKGGYGNGTTPNSTEAAPIQSISIDTVDNTNLKIMAGTNSGLVNSATAFMQGLYPPKAVNSSDPLAHNYDQGSNATDYPLNGYQYAKVLTFSNADSDSIVIQGDEECIAWREEMRQNLSKSSNTMSMISQTQNFYTALFESGPLQGLFPSSYTTYLYADEIYKTVKYHYEHNETVHRSLPNANDKLKTLEANAFALELSRISSNSTDKMDPLNVLYSISGRTLANKVTDIFSSFRREGSTNRMTLIFGSSRPMMSFFSAAELFSRQNPAAPFSQLPKPGSAIVFELIGSGQSRSDAKNLQVRFYYRPSADEADQFTPYPLFGSGFDGQVMSFDAFFRKMNDIGRTVSDWCKICNPATTSSFCLDPNIDGDDGDGWGDSSSRGIRAPIAGVLGALLMFIIIACVTAGFIVLGGWRFTRGSRQEGKSAAAGFRGDDRLASDADVTVSKSGRKEERVGSWELHDGGKETHTRPIGAGIVTSEFAHRAKRMDDDGVSVTGAPAVNAREGV
ncbi:hypothetical protein QQS21_011224 [Conoideocrella luteorostrata]|uniref:Histidine phosphatase superfamily n=1 Tax=Conoideocrella luteorostrata TaxID=1105319 RepID=A0AAJ0CDR2_9HYPO|nr:hypothetical protein QQS21_011224 [Conoideocrella luteorostrata]